jgi:hypothetical protein
MHSYLLEEQLLVMLFPYNNKITGWNRIRVTSANEPKIEKDSNLAQTNRRFQSGAFFG